MDISLLSRGKHLLCFPLAFGWLTVEEMVLIILSTASFWFPTPKYFLPAKVINSFFEHPWNTHMYHWHPASWVRSGGFLLSICMEGSPNYSIPFPPEKKNPGRISYYIYLHTTNLNKPPWVQGDFFSYQYIWILPAVIQSIDHQQVPCYKHFENVITAKPLNHCSAWPSW